MKTEQILQMVKGTEAALASLPARTPVRLEFTGMRYGVEKVDGGYLLTDCYGAPIATRPTLEELAAVVAARIEAEEKAQKIVQDAYDKADAVIEKAAAAMTDVAQVEALRFVKRHEGGKWVVYDHTGSEVLGRHDTEAGADAQLAAIEAAKKRRSGKMAEAAAARQAFAEREIEVMSVGTWNGIRFDQADLEQIAADTNAKIHLLKPFLKLGHDDEQKILQASGLPAAGWIDRLKVVGRKLVACTSGIPKKVEALLGTAYKRVSCELLMGWRDPETGRNLRVLSAVALLGADTPAVSDLDDIAALQYQEDKDRRIRLPVAFDGARRFAFIYEEGKQMPDPIKDPTADELKIKLANAEAAITVMQESLKREEGWRKSRLEGEASKFADDLVRFATAQETLRILPAAKEKFVALVDMLKVDHVAKFTEKPDQRTALVALREFVEALPSGAALFTQASSGPGGPVQMPSPNGGILMSEAIAEARKLEAEKKIPFMEALEKVRAEKGIRDSGRVAVDLRTGAERPIEERR